jgi:hypothetical protein
MRLFKLERGEACSNYSSDSPDWDRSEYFLNLEAITLETRRYKHSKSTTFYVFGWGLGSGIEVTEAAFKRIIANIENEL